MTLPVSNLVNITFTFTPRATGTRNFGLGIIVGSSAVIDTRERLRLYSGLTGVQADFPFGSPELTAANLYFNQNPRPQYLMIGRYAQQPTSGLLHGAILTPLQQLIANFNSITAGAIRFVIDGNDVDVTGIDLSQATNLNAVAAAVTQGLQGKGEVLWNATVRRFDVTATSTGPTSTVSYGQPVTPPPVGSQDLSALLGMTAASGATPPIAGIIAETPLQCVGALVNKSTAWYGLAFAVPANQPLSDAEHETVANYLQAVEPSRIYAATITETIVLDPNRADDLGSVLSSLGLGRAMTLYSSTSPYAVASLLGRIATVDFTGSNTTLTLMYKQLPGVVAEDLTVDQAAALKAKNVNVYASYDNGTAILQYGTMADGSFIDERQGVDWLQNDMTVGCFNLFYTNPTKISQTDQGMAQIATRLGKSLQAAVRNGLCAPGIWEYDGFGDLNSGDMLESGWYIYTPLVSTQSQADREARHSVPFQIALKGAGAVHDMTAAAQFNR